jgi:uncharacterized DUF497 family protein
MEPTRFDWDPAKAARNLAKHGIAFERAREAFSDENAIEVPDEDPDEKRFVLTGLAGGTVVVVVYTERGGSVRIISARRASKREQKEYFHQAR